VAELWWITATAPISLRDAELAVSRVFDSGATAFLSTPDDHIVAAFDGRELWTATRRCALDAVFAARLFAPPAELRWLHVADGLGQAVLLTERPGLIDGWAEQRAPVAESMDNSYALWGRQLEATTTIGWIRALEGRIGWIDVPIEGPVAHTPDDQEWPNQYVALQTVEYFGHDEHHNLRLVDERLVGLALTRPGNGRNFPR
jgi:CRISPR-associated protein (TIGR03984 family)